MTVIKDPIEKGTMYIHTGEVTERTTTHKNHGVRNKDLVTGSAAVSTYLSSNQ